MMLTNVDYKIEKLKSRISSTVAFDTISSKTFHQSDTLGFLQELARLRCVYSNICEARCVHGPLFTLYIYATLPTLYESFFSFHFSDEYLKYKSSYIAIKVMSCPWKQLSERRMPPLPGNSSHHIFSRRSGSPDSKEGVG